jgi:hypothetical protein
MFRAAALTCLTLIGSAVANAQTGAHEAQEMNVLQWLEWEAWSASNPRRPRPQPSPEWLNTPPVFESPPPLRESPVAGQGIAHGLRGLASSGGVGMTDKHGAQAGKWLELFDVATDFASEFEALSNVDARCAPDFSPPGSPVVPSMCEESRDADSEFGSGCGECYSKAIHRMNFNRFYLEKLRCIAQNTLHMANTAMKFGDNASGVHGVSGLAWQLGGKPEIEGAVKEFRKTYDRKYQQYLRGLRGSLDDLGQCEAQYMNNPDWYSRYGFVYYSFMEDRYRSPD